MTHKTVVYKYGTGNPVEPNGSGDVRDGIDNLQSFDVFMNAEEDTYNQRDGEIVQTVAGAIRSVGFKPGAGDFTTGFTVMPGQRDYAWYDPVSKNHYSYLGVIPPSGHVVSPATDPVGDPDWKPVTDQLLREELAQQSGSSMVGFIQSGTGSVPRTSQDKMREKVTPSDFGAVGDGVTNDTASFDLLEAEHFGKEIDLLGKTYNIDAHRTDNKYFNGSFVLPSGPSNARYQGAQLTGAGRIAFGNGALGLLPIDYSTGADGSVIAFGYGALGKVTQAKKTVAMGTNSQSETLISFDNLSIGEDSLKHIQSRNANYDSSQRQGTRNVALGGNAGHFAVDVYGMVAIGRNAAHCIEAGAGLVAIGNGAVGGYATIGLSGIIENGAPWGVDGQVVRTVGIGIDALGKNLANNNLAVGGESLQNNKKSDNNVALGARSLNALDTNTGYTGGSNVTTSIAGTYSHSGNVLTMDFIAHGMVVGDKAQFRLLDGDSQTFQNDIVIATIVTVPSANSVTVAHPVSRTASGNAQLYGYETGAQQPLNSDNTAIGVNAGASMLTGNSNFFGGTSSGFALTNATRMSLAGWKAMPSATSGNACTSIGSFSTYNMTGAASQVTALGDSALRNKSDGTILSENFANITGIGYDSRVSGANQVQLGNASTTTYVYGTVQNRSDARDKTDYDDTVLGIEFIMGLRPVDGRWDMRDDYTEEYQVQVGIDENAVPVFETRTRQLPKDGSRARTRKHHWFIAQEVKELCDSLGVEFGGYQDHSINGGCDVLSLGYDEFIPPTVKAVQQCWTRLDELEKRIAALE